MKVEPPDGAEAVGGRLEIHYCGEEWAALFVRQGRAAELRERAERLLAEAETVEQGGPA